MLTSGQKLVEINPMQMAAHSYMSAAAAELQQKTTS
jgi:hypothetical protein